jgi:hypothetical protein
MAVFRDLYEIVRALLKRKLGACPKCMASSIVGSGLSWLGLAILYAMWPNRLTLTFGLVVAAAFTVLMIAHVVVHMFRVAPVVRNLPENRQLKSRREFALAVGKAGFSFAAAALVSLPFFPERAEAAKGATTYALYCVGCGCATQAQGVGIGIFCETAGFRAGAQVNVACGRTAPTSIVCTSGACSVVLELLDSTCGSPTATIVSLKSFKCGPVTSSTCA